MTTIVPRIISVTERPATNTGGRAGWNGVIHIWQRGETVFENLVNRRCRPYTTYRKEILPLLVKQYPMLAEFRISWSQRAGCSCPCSPGFIVLPKKGEWRRWRSDLCVEIEWVRR